MYGDDIALAVVEIDHKDKYYNKYAYLHTKLNIPPPIFLTDKEEKELAAS